MSEDAEKFSRRRFFGTIGVAAAGVAAVGALAVPLAERRGELKRPYPEVHGNQVILPANGQSVLIIGGGLSGLQTGVELAARGFKVTILEKSGSPGGKLKSWRDRHFGPTDDPYKNNPAFPGYVREHGVHAVWGFYNNLREFFGRYHWPLMDMPKDLSIYHFRDRDGTVSHLPNTTWVPPYGTLQLVEELSRLKHLAPADHLQAVDLFSRLATFDYADARQRQYMDSMTFEEYARRLGLSSSLVHKICDSLLEMAYFDNVDKASALTLANLIQLVAGSSRDLRINLYHTPVAESFIQPMVNFIQAHGGEVHFNTEVTGLLMQQGKMLGAKAAALPRQAIQRCSICGGLIFAGMEVGGECPYCGANADVLRDIQAQERQERRFEADYVVCALDGPGLKNLVAANREVLGDAEYFRQIERIEAKAVFVCNLWFEGRGPWEKTVQDEVGRPAICFFATGFKHLGITINRAVEVIATDEQRLVWSNEFVNRDVTVIETQIAKTDLVEGLSSAAIADLCYGELKTVMPQLPPPVSSYVNRWYNYNAYHVGSESHRPAVQSPIDNLLIVGDNAFVPHPAVFMEKTNVTAKWATNLILDKAGMSQYRIEILPSGTPSTLIRGLSEVRSVYL